MKTVPLHGKKAAGRVVLVDDEDYDLVMQYRWYVWEFKREGARTNGPYAVTVVYGGGSQQSIFMHKLITGYPMTDHVDHDGLNNQRSNLRPATRPQNMHNRQAAIRGASRYKGVCWVKKRGHWRADIRKDGKKVYLGAFATEEAAARAYDDAARVIHGSYALLNFPDS